jgi:hypothetical protein
LHPDADKTLVEDSRKVGGRGPKRKAEGQMLYPSVVRQSVLRTS